MHETVNVPVDVTPEAAARVAELGMQAALERTLAKVREMVPDLERLEVLLEPADDTGNEPYLTIQAHVTRWPRWDDSSQRAWARWQLAAFPPEVVRHVALLVEPVGGRPDPG